MRSKILAACVALSFAAACEQGEPRSAAAPEVAAQPVVADASVATQVAEVPAPTQVAVMEPTAVVAEPLELKTERDNIDHLARANTLFTDGDSGGAVQEARRALFLHPDDEETVRGLAKLAQRAGQHTIAARAFSRLGTLASDDAAPLIQATREYLKAGRVDEALIVGLSSTLRDPTNPEAHHALGRAYLSLGELGHAIERFSTTIDLAPNHAWAKNNLGYAYLRANENEKAVAVLTEAAEALPNAAAVHNNLGVALERVGRGEEAKESYARATVLSPKYVKARVNLNRVAQAPTISPDEPTDESLTP